MPLPSSWVDSLFARLAVRYGNAWIRMWEGVDIAAVKADWSNELEGFSDHPEAIAYGLDHLPLERPPTVAQFRELCIRRPDAAQPKLPAPSADPAVVAKVLGAFKKPDGADPKAWAWRLKEREETGDRLSKAQRDMWREALKAEMQDAPPLQEAA